MITEENIQQRQKEILLEADKQLRLISSEKTRFPEENEIAAMTDIVTMRLARIELMLEQKEEKSFEDWWEKYHTEVRSMNTVGEAKRFALTIWNAARGK